MKQARFISWLSSHHFQLVYAKIFATYNYIFELGRPNAQTFANLLIKTIKITVITGNLTILRARSRPKSATTGIRKKSTWFRPLQYRRRKLLMHDQDSKEPSTDKVYGWQWHILVFGCSSIEECAQNKTVIRIGKTNSKSNARLIIATIRSQFPLSNYASG